MVPQQYCLRWKHHHSNVQNMFAQLLEKERFCDVTLYCSPSFATQVPNKDTIDPQNIRGVSLRAHRVVLAACSELLGTLLGAHEAQGEPVLVIDGAEPKHLKALLDYMYTGEMNVHHSQLASLLKTAEELRIKGLTDIRWNNKDEPPDCEPGVVATATPADTKQEKQASPKPAKQPSPKQASPKQVSPKRTATPKPIADQITPELRAYLKKEQENCDVEIKTEKCNVNEPSPSPPEKHNKPELRTYEKKNTFICDVGIIKEKGKDNGGPPPLIKLPTKEKSSPTKRENSDSDSPSSPKRQRLASGTEHTDEDSLSHIKSERDQEWQHGNMDISAEPVGGAGGGTGAGWGAWSREVSDDEWADAPADIGSFLHTRLRVDGDNSADEESNESGCGAPAASSSSSAPSDALGTHHAHANKQSQQNEQRAVDFERTCEAFGFNISRVERAAAVGATVGPKSGPTDPRFTDVVKLSDYLQHGRRPQFWEEHYVKRVMEAVRVKELEMKQAAEILGVSYGTLYGRYRDVYGCINRPYRSIGGVREFWQAKGPSEVLEQLQRGDISLDAAARALGVSIANLAAHVADFGLPEKDFEPIPIEVDPSLKLRPRTYSTTATATAAPVTGKTTRKPVEKPIKKILIGSMTDEDPIPATVITTHEAKFNVTTTTSATTTTMSGKWPSIRVASLDTLRGGDSASTPSTTPSSTQSTPPTPPAPPSPCALMRTRPDLTIVAARKPEVKRDDDTT